MPTVINEALHEPDVIVTFLVLVVVSVGIALYGTAIRWPALAGRVGGVVAGGDRGGHGRATRWLGIPVEGLRRAARGVSRRGRVARPRIPIRSKPTRCSTSLLYIPAGFLLVAWSADRSGWCSRWPS